MSQEDRLLTNEEQESCWNDNREGGCWDIQCLLKAQRDLTARILNTKWENILDETATETLAMVREAKILVAEEIFGEIEGKFGDRIGRIYGISQASWKALKSKLKGE